MREKSLLALAIFLLLATVFGTIIYFKSGGTGFQNKIIIPTQPVSPTIKQTENNQPTQSTEGKIKTPEGLTLTITEPTDKITVNNPNLTVKGKTTPKAAVFINDQEIKADEQGNFTTSIILDEGENTLVIAANDDLGNYAEKEMTVTLENLE